MRRFIPIMALLAVALCQEKPAPEWGWKPFASKTVGLGFSDHITIPLPRPFSPKTMSDVEDGVPLMVRKDRIAASPRGTSLRVEISADTPVSFGIFPVTDGALDGTANPKCSEPDVFEAKRECDLSESSTALAVVDSRNSKTTPALAALGIATRNTELVTAAARTNRVKIVLYRWECIRYCS